MRLNIGQIANIALKFQIFADITYCHCQLGLRGEEFGGFRERGIPQAKFGKNNDWSKGEGGRKRRFILHLIGGYMGGIKM